MHTINAYTNTYKTNFYLNLIALNKFHFSFSGDRNREERRSLNRGWRPLEIEDPFLLFGSHRNIPKFASRRESVDSSEERDDSKDGSESGKWQ